MSERPTRTLTPAEEAHIKWMYEHKGERKLGFITTTAPVPMGSTDDKGPWGPNPRKIIPAGRTLRIVMVSRFGDCGLTDDLKAQYGYDVRLSWEDAAMMDIRPNKEPTT